MIKRLALSTLITTVLMNMTGCASNPADPIDPMEGFNRQVFKLNMAVDSAVFRPAAKAYNKITPSFVQARVSNFFNNIDLIPTVANDILQLRVYQTLHDTSRFVCNSTVGIGGLFDVGSHIGLLPYHNDLGLTLARWGLPESPYLVMPLFGPTTFRDAIADPIQFAFMTPWPLVPWQAAYPLYGLSKVSMRAALLPADQILYQAYDPYVLMRSAYLQRRQREIQQLNQMDPQLNTASNQDPFVGDSISNSGNPTNSNSASTNTSNTGDDTFVPADSQSTANTKNSTATTTPKSNQKLSMAELPTPAKLN